jgi:hypothetical protein
MVGAEDDRQDTAELERMNAELTESLKRCRRIVSDCQSRLVANCNEAEPQARASEIR